ncbi:MAG TPA: MBL fold metallo-hydrolase [Thermoanaerobaculia bacterium]|nr:MBL fold metallo-hydrolase [Thermoanaerobaculia bacterium]
MDTYEVAKDTFVIPDGLPVPGVGKLPVNAMVIRGRQPMILDTLAIVHRDRFLEEVFKIVEPADVRWLFLSHEDRDHSGAIMQVLERCPKARLITTFLGLGKLGEEFTIPLDRVYLLNDGDTLDAGDRKLTAVRPPLYDSSATRGIWDPSTSVYYAADCFGIVSEEVPQFTDEMPESDFEEGYFWMNRANHIWYQHIRQDAIDESAKRIKGLGAKTIVSGHGPTERKNTGRMVDWITRIVGMEPVEMPDQAQFEAMISGKP